MGHIRPFEKTDIPRVVELNRRLFPRNADRSVQTIQSNFEEIFFNNPWTDAAHPSLVYEDIDGRIAGFVGITMRRMTFKERSFRLAISQHLMVDPESRASLAGMELLREFLKGPQDLSIADMANDVSRKLWERLGGSTSFVHSYHWRRLIRPVGFGLGVIARRKKFLAPLATIVKPISLAVDSLSARFRPSPFRVRASALVEEEPDVDTLIKCIADFSKTYAIRPEYDRESLQWALSFLKRQNDFGTFRMVVLRNARGTIQGWYMCYLNPEGVSEVIHVGGREGTFDSVLDHLAYQAWVSGARDLTGRVEPRFMKSFASRAYILSPGLMWMLVHSKDPELLQAVNRGDAFLSRLEGDLWMI